MGLGGGGRGGVDRGQLGRDPGGEADQAAAETLPGRGEQEDRARVREHGAAPHRHPPRQGGQALEHHQALQRRHHRQGEDHSEGGLRDCQQWLQGDSVPWM